MGCGILEAGDFWGVRVWLGLGLWDLGDSRVFPWAPSCRA